MLTDEQRSQPVTAQDVADALLFVLIETFAALSPDAGTASDKLEDAAGKLLGVGNDLLVEPVRSIVLATAQNLIENETGLFKGRS